MDAKLTVSVRGLLLTGVALLGLLAAYLLGAAGGGSLAGTPAHAADDPQTSDVRSVTVVGVGTATAVPDQLGFSVSVSTKSADLDLALADANESMRAVLAALDEQGVAKSDTQTTGLSMDPEYYYPNSGSPVLTGYRVTQRLRVQVTDLATGGKVIGSVVAAGGNSVRVAGIRLEVGDPEAAIARARDAAVAEAKAKAEQYAAATGAALGDVLTVREVSAPTEPSVPVLQRAGAYDAVAGSKVPIRAGESDLTVRVQVVWGLE